MLTEQIELMLKNGIIPVLHGDVVCDECRGPSILSGDQLVVYLGMKLGADRVGVGTNVDVIKDGKKIKEVNGHIFRRMEDSGLDGVDVTGGMIGKIAELLELADHNIFASIFNASKRGETYRFLCGEDIGTVVR
jgi:isopentenyl phosphate kinase